MKVQYRIPAKITGTMEKNFVEDAKGIIQLFKVYRKAKKAKASALFIFF